MNKFAILFFIVIKIFTAGSAVCQDLQFFYTAAKEAKEKKDYASFYSNIVEASKMHPYHQLILYQKGIACALTGRTVEAIDALHQAILIDHSLDLSIEDLKSLGSSSDFAELVALQTQLRKTVVTSDTAFVMPDANIHIESVAYDPSTGAFYLGSINKRKILKREPTGKITEFTKSNEHNMTAVFGLRIDSKNKMLWACASPMPEMEDYDSTLNSAVYKFDLRSGKLLASFKTDLPVTFGDLALDQTGKVFVSDSQSNKIFVVNEQTKALDLFYESSEFWNIQGINFSNNNETLFISDYIKGPYRLDLKDKTLHKLSSPKNQSLKGIDGFLFYSNSLVALQNGVTPFRVMQYSLNEDGTDLVDVEIIDWAHPAFGEPTIGCIDKDTLYYVANSQWGAYNEDRKFQPDKAKKTVILKHVFRE